MAAASFFSGGAHGQARPCSRASALTRRPPLPPPAPRLPPQDAAAVTTTAAKAGYFEARFFHKVFCEEFANARGHFSPINSVAFSPDGTAFVTGAEEGNVRLHHFDAGAWPRPRRRCGCRSRLRQLGSAGRAATFRPCPASLIVTCLPLPLPVQTTSRQTGTGSESSGRGLVATAAGTRRAAAALHAKPASRLRPVARFFAPPTHATFHVCFFQFCLHALLACHIASACLPVLGPGGAHQRRCPACTSSFRCQSAIFLLTSAHAFFTRM